MHVFSKIILKCESCVEIKLNFPTFFDWLPFQYLGSTNVLLV